MKIKICENVFIGLGRCFSNNWLVIAVITRLLFYIDFLITKAINLPLTLRSFIRFSCLYVTLHAICY